MKQRVDCTIRFATEDGGLVARFRAYIKKNWANQRGAQSFVIKQAIVEFLDRHEGKSKGRRVGRPEI